MHMNTSVREYAFAYVHSYVCTCMHVCVNGWMHLCMVSICGAPMSVGMYTYSISYELFFRVCMHLCLYVCLCLHMRACNARSVYFLHVYVHLHACECASMFTTACVHVDMHVYLYGWV